MPPFSNTVRSASEGAERILHRVCPRAFGYRLQSGRAGWTLRVERATDAGWRAYELPVDPAELSGSLRDAAVRERLSQAWAQQLGVA
ncbi:MAG TPA: hypothetical protein VKA16_11560 [Burkholderiales bacterium]|nr:hypothetical protein [Burkholderiales bacterium]